MPRSIPTARFAPSARPAAIMDCRGPSSVASLAEADTTAARALEAFTEWLGSDAMPRAGESWSMGAEAYARWLEASVGDTLGWAAIRTRARRELDAAGAGPC